MVEPSAVYPSTPSERKEVQDQLAHLLASVARLEVKVAAMDAAVNGVDVKVDRIIAQRTEEASVLRFAAAWRSASRWALVTVGAAVTVAAATGQLGWVKPVLAWMGR